MIVAGVDYDSFGVYMALVDADDSITLSDLVVIRFRDKGREDDKSYAFPASLRVPAAIREALRPARRTPALAYIEHGFSPKGQQRQAFGLGRVQGLILGALLELRVPVDELTPAEWRKELGVPGNCSKAEAHAALFDNLGAPFYGYGDPRLGDVNVRDAAAIAYAGARRNARGAS